MNRRLRAAGAVTSAALLGLSVLGCSNSDPEPTSAATGAAVDVAVAEDIVGTYRETPPFPIDVALSAPVPANTEIAYISCQTAVCAYFEGLLKPAAEVLGMKLVTIRTGASAESQQSAVSSVVAMQPGAVLLSPHDPSIIGAQLKELDAAGIPVISMGVLRGADYGIDIALTAERANEQYGRILAAYLLATYGDVPTVVYDTPELPFTTAFRAGFDTQVDELCPDCELRSVKVPVATIGNRAPSQIVSDLQAHPETQVMAFSNGAMATGLAPALKTANLSDVEAVLHFPSNDVLQNLLDGSLKGGALALDFKLIASMAMDVAARTVVGDPLTTAEEADDMPKRLLEQDDIDFDPANGYVAYPDYEERLEELWSF